MSSKYELKEQVERLREKIEKITEYSDETWLAILEILPDKHQQTLTLSDYLLYWSIDDRSPQVARFKDRAERARRLADRVRKEQELKKIKKMKTPEALEYLLKKTQ